VTAPAFGVCIPATGPLADPVAFGDAVDAIEALGYEDVWFGDHVAVPKYAAHITSADWLEPISCCLLALGRTTRLRAGTDVLVVPYRNPLLLAKMAATADALSGGRLVLGVGVGYLRGEFVALGADYDRRGAVTDEYLRALGALWDSAGAPTSFAGEAITFDDVCMGPRPTRGRVPVWVGGNVPAALRRAATLGDGWHPLFPAPADYRRGRETIVDARGSSDGFTFSVSLATTKVLDRGATFTPTTWSGVDVPDDFGYAPAVPMTDDGRIRFIGDPEQVAADVDDYVAAGAEHFTLRFSAGGDDTTVAEFLDQVERFASEVAPRVRRA
jgi:probable F420-dependent oxidoreductase